MVREAEETEIDNVYNAIGKIERVVEKRRRRRNGHEKQRRQQQQQHHADAHEELRPRPCHVAAAR